MNILKENRVRIICGDKEFKDKRGKIVNYEFLEPINWIGLVTSKKGCIRANHYHPIQEQKVLLISGSYVGVYKDLNDPTNKLEEKLIESGNIEIISPKIAHAMVFLKDSVFINLVNGEREHKNYSRHTVPYEVVADNQIKDYLQKYKDE